MIQAENPDKIDHLQHQDTLVSTVYGFGKNADTATDTTASNPEIQNLVEKNEKIDKRELKEHIFHWWHKIAIVLLTAHSIYDLWEATSFFLFEYAHVDKLLSLHQIESTEINHLVGSALIDLGQGLVSAFFAVRLFKVKETTEHNIDLIASTLLILSTKFVQDFFVELDIVNLIVNYFSK